MIEVMWLGQSVSFRPGLQTDGCSLALWHLSHPFYFLCVCLFTTHALSLSFFAVLCPLQFSSRCYWHCIVTYWKKWQKKISVAQTLDENIGISVCLSLCLCRDHVFAINLSASVERIVPQQVSSPFSQLSVSVFPNVFLSLRSVLWVCKVEYSLLFVFGEGPFRNPIFQMSNSLYGGFKGRIFYTFITLSIFPRGLLEMLVKVSYTKNSHNLVSHDHFPPSVWHLELNRLFKLLYIL